MGALVVAARRSDSLPILGPRLGLGLKGAIGRTVSYNNPHVSGPLIIPLVDDSQIIIILIIIICTQWHPWVAKGWTRHGCQGPHPAGMPPAAAPSRAWPPAVRLGRRGCGSSQEVLKALMVLELILLLRKLGGQGEQLSDKGAVVLGGQQVLSWRHGCTR